MKYLVLITLALLVVFGLFNGSGAHIFRPLLQRSEPVEQPIEQTRGTYNNNNYFNNNGWTAFSDQSSVPFSTFMSEIEQFGIYFKHVNGYYAFSATMNSSFSFTAHGSDFKLAGNLSSNNFLGTVSPVYAEQLFVQSSKSRFLWSIGGFVMYLSNGTGTLVNQSGSCYYIPGVTFSRQEGATSAERDISVALQMNPYTGVFRWVVQYFAEYFGDFAADCLPVAEMSAVTPVYLDGVGNVLLPYFVPYAQVFPIYFFITNNFANISFAETIGNEAWSYYGNVHDSDFEIWDNRCNFSVATNYYSAFFTPFGFCNPPTTANPNGVIMPYTPSGV